MKFVPVESSNIKAIAWEDNKLFVEFLNNNIYMYENVSWDTYIAFMHAESKGRFLNLNIKKQNYKYSKIN